MKTASAMSRTPAARPKTSTMELMTPNGLFRLIMKPEGEINGPLRPKYHQRSEKNATRNPPRTLDPILTSMAPNKTNKPNIKVTRGTENKRAKNQLKPVHNNPAIRDAENPYLLLTNNLNQGRNIT